MSSLLDKSSRPLWVWIIVIVIGSLVILGTVTFLVRCLMLRRRARSDVELISDEPAEKKFTLRRGRIVPSNNYLSLTGSRFGLGSYAAEEGLQSPSVRSKSPFEWWANLRGRSSRLSYVSHISSSQYPSSPLAGSLYERQERSTSKLSMVSKDDTIRATVTEVKVARPQSTLLNPSLKRMSRSFEPVNFSRSFTPQAQRSLAAFRNQTLSRIDETEPRRSFFSAASIKARLGGYSTPQNSPIITITDPQPSNRASGASFLQMPPSIFTHSRNTPTQSARNIPQEPQMTQIPRSPSPTYLPSMPTTPTFPEPIATKSAYTSLWGSSMKQFPWLEHQHHQDEDLTSDFDHDQEPTLDHVLPQFDTSTRSELHMTTSPALQPPRTMDVEQPPVVTDPQPSSDPSVGLGIVSSRPLSTRSKKGNVLRKKSLRRMEVF